MILILFISICLLSYGAYELSVAIRGEGNY